jgi:hypothetical protein
MEKQCKKCGETKDLTEYYTAKGTVDGRHGSCKTCMSKAHKARYQRIVSPELLQSFNEKYHERKKDPEWLVSQRIKVRERRRKRIEAGIKRDEPKGSLGTINPIKKKARAMVSNAIRDGRMLRQPCLVCGCKAAAHHEDYSKPLSVHWLCTKHHMDRHVHLNTAETLKIKPLTIEDQFNL